jgi:hypothetical protein
MVYRRTERGNDAAQRTTAGIKNNRSCMPEGTFFLASVLLWQIFSLQSGIFAPK